MAAAEVAAAQKDTSRWLSIAASAARRRGIAIALRHERSAPRASHEHVQHDDDRVESDRGIIVPGRPGAPPPVLVSSLML